MESPIIKIGWSLDSLRVRGSGVARGTSRPSITFKSFARMKNEGGGFVANIYPFLLNLPPSFLWRRCLEEAEVGLRFPLYKHGGHTRLATRACPFRRKGHGDYFRRLTTFPTLSLYFIRGMTTAFSPVRTR